MKGKSLFLLRLTPSRPNFLETMSDDEKQIIAEHFEYFKELQEQDTLLMAGRTANASIGLGMLYAFNEDNALSIIKKDPAITAGIFYFIIEKFSIALFNHRLVSENE